MLILRELLGEDRMITFDDGYIIKVEGTVIEVWRNFETLCTINTANVTEELACQILGTYGVACVPRLGDIL